jgi:hypothetical protein
MQKLLSFLPLIALVASPLAAMADSDVDGARRADDARVAAIVSGDPAKMDAVFSPDLIYTHSTGRINHKADLIKAIAGQGLHYLSIDYEARNFRAVAPGIVLVSGRCRIHSSNNGQEEHNYLSFLTVYRNEAGTWRFLAWQSCKLTAGSPPLPQ